MKKLMAIVIVLLVAVLMTLTKPDEQKHKDAMMSAIKEFVDQEAQDHGIKDNVLTKLGKNVVNQAIKTALNSKLKFDNYYLFNTTHVKLKGEEQILSLGIFGQVITFDKDMLKEKLAEAAKNVKGILTVEMSAGQMIEDVKLATNCGVKVEHFGRFGGIIPTPTEVLEALENKIVK